MEVRSPRAAREGWQRATHGRGLYNAQASPVFPEYIYIDLEDFRRAAEPFCERDRPTSSRLYKARVSAQGRILCTRRMQRWLHGLPDTPGACSEPLAPEPCPELPCAVFSRESVRPRAHSEPAPTPCGPAAFRPGNDPSSSRLLSGHPNPLSQHPVKPEERDVVQPRSLPWQPDTPAQLHEVGSRLADDSPGLGEAHPQLQDRTKLEEAALDPAEVKPRFEKIPSRLRASHLQIKIPRRRSSLYFTSQPAPHAQQSHHLMTEFDDLFRGLEQAQAGEHEASESDDSQGHTGTCEKESVASPPKSEDQMVVFTRPTKKRHTFHPGHLAPMDQQKVHDGNVINKGRAHSGANAVDYGREKGLMSLFGSVRARRSAMGTPAGDLNHGRRSSASVMLRDMGKSSKEFFSKLTSRKKDEYKFRIAFIGNQQCGKEDLLSRYTVAASIGSSIYSPDTEPIRVKLTGVLTVDDCKARTEVWDVAHQNIKTGQPHPLTMVNFDVVVICVDVGDERNLKSVAKWSRVAQKHCPGVPTIVLGLRADLRPGFPTLRLGFLRESAAFTVGQGEEAARKNKASAYYECSAKTGEGVTEFFESLVRFSVQATRTRSKLRQKASRGFSSLSERLSL